MKEEMTANELADKLDLIRIELTIQASAMLRQQAKEIEALRLRELTDEEITEEIEKMFGKIIDPEVLKDELTLARAILRKAREK
jgi:hypothetical protein